MSITAAVLTASDEPDWNGFVAAHPEATIYHSLAWRNVTVEGFGHRPFLLLARDGSGRPAGVLPLFLVRGIWGRRLVSVPMRDRAGILADGPAAADALVAAALALTRQLRARYLEIKQLRPLEQALASKHHLRQVQHWVTTRVDLTVGADRIWAGLDKDAVRWAIKKARRSNVRVEEDHSAAGIARFYDLFSRTRTRMGIPPFPRSLFDAIHRHILLPGLGSLCFVLHEDRYVHGMISLYSHDTFLPAYAAPQRYTGPKLYESEVMLWHTIEAAAGRGFMTYDFGADSPRQDGLLRFKRKWGGVQHPVTGYFSLGPTETIPESDSSSPGYQRLRQIWARLPLSASRLAGGWITRQLA